MISEIIALILIPLVFSFLALVSSDKHLNKIVAVGSLLMFLYSISIQIYYFASGMPIEHLVYGVPGVVRGVYGLTVDPLSVYIGSIIGVVSSIILYYAIDYMSPDNSFHPVLTGRQRYFAWMFFFVFSVLLFVYSYTLLQLLIGFELMSLACWGLISYYGTSEATRSSYKMLITTHIGAYSGLAVLTGLVYMYTGSFSINSLSLLPTGYRALAVALAMWAAITKSSQFPTYSWLPDAMVAPTPTSALLHGATMVEMGPYLVARVILGLNNVSVDMAPIVLVPVMFSLFLAAIFYPGIRDGKRLLAYSTIAEVGVMFITVSVMFYNTSLGLILYMLHFTVHAFLKSLGFLLMGYGGYTTGTHELSRITSLFCGNRLLYNLALVVFYGLSGIPLYAISKIYILVNMGALLGNAFYLSAILIVLFEAAVFLLNTTRLFKPGTREVKAVIPSRMKASFITLLILLYVYQAVFMASINELTAALGG